MVHFKDPVILKVEENTEVVLNFTEPGSGGRYEEIYLVPKMGLGAAYTGLCILGPV